MDSEGCKDAAVVTYDWVAGVATTASEEMRPVDAIGVVLAPTYGAPVRPRSRRAYGPAGRDLVLSIGKVTVVPPVRNASAEGAPEDTAAL